MYRNMSRSKKEEDFCLSYTRNWFLPVRQRIDMTSHNGRANGKEGDHLLSDVEEGRLDRPPSSACPLDTPSEISLNCIWAEII